MDGFSGKNSGRHEKTEEARRKELEERGLGAEGVRIMKDQDLSYVRMQRVMDGRKVERLQSSLHYLEGGAGEDEEDGDDAYAGDGRGTALNKMLGKKRKHTVFIEGGQTEVDTFDVAQHFDTIPELVGRSFNRPRVKTLEKQALAKLGKIPIKDVDDDYYNNDNNDDDDNEDYDEQGNPLRKQHQLLTPKQILKQQKQQHKLEKRIAKQRSAAYSEMELRNARLMKLKNAEDHLVVQKNVQMKGRKRKIEGKSEDGKPAVYKWRRTRAK